MIYLLQSGPCASDHTQLFFKSCYQITFFFLFLFASSPPCHFLSQNNYLNALRLSKTIGEKAILLILFLPQTTSFTCHMRTFTRYLSPKDIILVACLTVGV